MSESTPAPGAAPDAFDRVLGVLCALPVALIVGLTFAEVFARYLFSAPIRGSTEIIEYAMALVIFAALPLITKHRGHVSVSLIDGVVRGGMRRVKNVLCDAVSCFALGLLAWRLWLQAVSDQRAKVHTVVLEWPHAPLYYAMAAFAAVSALAMLWLTWRSLRGTEHAA